MRVLVVEDEPDLAAAIRLALSEEGFACDVAEDGEIGLHQGRSGVYDLIVLDLMLPRVNGLTVLERLRAAGAATPVLILTARDTTVDKVAGLDAGADDYLTKPFELEELLARIRALIRRAHDRPSPIIQIENVRIDTASHEVDLDNEPVPLTAKEYALLELLAMNQGRLVTRTIIYERLYDETENTFSNSVDVHIANLRKKLGRALIQTRRGEGYLIP